MSVEELPEEGELVLASVDSITPHGAYVSLDEYGGMPAFLHISEVSTGWVRNIERFVRKGQKVVLKVIRVDKRRMEVDVSLKQVTNEERRRKLAEVKKQRKAEKIFQLLGEELGIEEDELLRYMGLFEAKFGTLYRGFEKIVDRGEKAVEGLGLPEPFLKRLVEVVKEKIKPPEVEIAGIVEASCPGSYGIEVLKDALLSSIGRSSRGSVNLIYMGAPRYRLTVRSKNFKLAERLLSSTIERLEGSLRKKGCTFKFTREESRKIR